MYTYCSRMKRWQCLTIWSWVQRKCVVWHLGQPAARLTGLLTCGTWHFLIHQSPHWFHMFCPRYCIISESPKTSNSLKAINAWVCAVTQCEWPPFGALKSFRSAGQMVQCQKVLSQSLKNEMSLTVVIGACFGGSFFHGNGFVWIKDESWLVFIISLFEIDISVHVTRDMWQHKLSCCMHNIWEIMFKEHMYILQPKCNACVMSVFTL